MHFQRASNRNNLHFGGSVLSIPQFFFDLKRGEYWMELNPGRFVSMGASDLKLHLRRNGLRKDTFDTTGLNDLERAIAVCQIERWIDYAAPLSGHRPGMFKSGSGRRVLVTEAVKLPEAKRGSCSRFMAYLDDLFADADHGDIQRDVCLAWLKCARESFLAGDFRPGQMLVLAGPSGCGKSLFQLLVTEWLGGRVGLPFRYMNAETPFNADLASAEHLMLEDKGAASFDIRTRRKFGESVKDFVVCSQMSIHDKGIKAEVLATFRRVTMSINDEPENLLSCPPLDPSIQDKIIILKCVDAGLSGSRATIWKQLTSELPALAWHLDRWKLPPEMCDRRYGVKAWHHPELLEGLQSLSDETRLLSLIDQVLFTGQLLDGPWTGTSEKLEAELVGSAMGFAATKILGKFTGACGTYLGRLKGKTDRITSKKLHGTTVWAIRSPEGR